MVNLNEYQILLSIDDWDRLGRVLGDNIYNLGFEETQNKYDLLEMVNGKYSVDHWKNEFNYKLAAISINYGYMYTYFEKLEGYDIYKEKDKDKIAYHFWFSYETESLLARLFTLVDNLYHIINIKYELEVQEGIKFRPQLVEKLTSKNKILAQYLNNLIHDKRYKDVQKIRNDFTHNHSPLNLTSGIKRERNGGFWTMSKGEYIKPEMVLKYVDDFICLLNELTTECKKYI